MSLNIEMKPSLPAEQDHNSVPDSFCRGHDRITHVRRARLLTVLETLSECVIVIVIVTTPSLIPAGPDDRLC